MPLSPEKIDRAAAKAGIKTRAAIAARLETTPQNLSRMLSGRHRVYLEDAERISAVVKCPLAKLLA